MSAPLSLSTEKWMPDLDDMLGTTAFVINLLGNPEEQEKRESLRWLSDVLLGLTGRRPVSPAELPEQINWRAGQDALCKALPALALTRQASIASGPESQACQAAAASARLAIGAAWSIITGRPL